MLYPPELRRRAASVSVRSGDPAPATPLDSRDCDRSRGSRSPSREGHVDADKLGPMSVLAPDSLDLRRSAAGAVAWAVGWVTVAVA